jgi:hypothetical protein
VRKIFPLKFILSYISKNEGNLSNPVIIVYDRHSKRHGEPFNKLCLSKNRDVKLFTEGKEYNKKILNLHIFFPDFRALFQFLFGSCKAYMSLAHKVNPVS